MAEEPKQPPPWGFKEWTFAITAIVGLFSNVLAIAAYAKQLEANQLVMGYKLDNQTKAIEELKATANEREGRIRTVEREVAELRADMKMVMRVVGARRAESE